MISGFLEFVSKPSILLSSSWTSNGINLMKLVDKIKQYDADPILILYGLGQEENRDTLLSYPKSYVKRISCLRSEISDV